MPLLLPLSSYPQAAHLKKLLIDHHEFVEAMGCERKMGRVDSAGEK